MPVEQQRGSDSQIEAPGDAEYFVQYVRERLARRYGPAAVFGGGLRVQTTLDLDYQAAAEAAIEEALPTPGDPGASLVAIEPATGHILAMAGGRDFATSQLNLATFRGGTGRQAGSAFKAFTLAEAMEEGFDLNSSWYGPNSITIDDPVCDGPEGPWQPENAEGGGSTYSLQAATAHSVNTVFAQLVVELGPSSVVDMAHRLGIRSALPAVCSITLGKRCREPDGDDGRVRDARGRGDAAPPQPLATGPVRRGGSIPTRGCRAASRSWTRTSPISSRTPSRTWSSTAPEPPHS